MEKEIELEQEAIVVYSGGGAVNSVNGYTGDVVLTTSDLENTSDYQTGAEVESAISTAIAGKQDTLTAGNNITISNNTISATDTTYSAGTGLTLDGTQFSVDTSTIATQQDVSNEATARENADNNLQGQIDAISASSDVTDIVGTYADLQAYDTTHLKDNDIIKVLQDESQNDETTYYRWSTSTQTFTLIGEEGPYYTKSQTDTLLQAKQDTLTAGSNITIASDNTISATDTTYTAGTNVSISSGNVISATDTTYSDFTGTDGTTAGEAGLVPAPATTDAGKFLKADGTWDTAGGGGGDTVYSSKTTSNSATGGAVYIGNLGTDQTEVADPTTTDNHYKYFWALPASNNGASYGLPGKGSVNIMGSAKGAESVAIGNQAGMGSYGAAYSVMIGSDANAGPSGVSIGHSSGTSQDYVGNVCIGANSKITSAGITNSVALGRYSTANRSGEVNVGTGNNNYGFNSTKYRVIGGVHDPQSDHDAATKGYVDTAVNTIDTALDAKQDELTPGTGISITEESGALVISATGGSGGGAIELTSADYNWPIANPVGVALWLLDNGTYYVADSSVGVYVTNAKIASQGIYVVADYDTASKQVIVNDLADEIYGVYRVNKTTGAQGAYHPYAPTVVQTTGSSTTNVMSQNAVTSMVYADPATQSKVKIGAGTSSSEGTDGVEIGHYAGATGVNSVALGAVSSAGNTAAIAIGPASYATGTNSIFIGDKNGAGNGATGDGSIGIGVGTRSTGQGSVAIGATSRATTNGQFDIGANATYYGYNSSNYRLLTGLYDGQSAHDAVTVEQVNATIDAINTALSTNIPHIGA